MFELAYRTDEVTTESDESAVETRYRTWTSGLNYLYRDFVKVQANWVVRQTDNPFEPDLGDDTLILSLQGQL